MSEKVKLTKEQAHVLKEWEDLWSDEKIVEMIISAREEGATDADEEVLIQLSTDTLIRAIYIGYDVELSVEEQLLEFYNNCEEDKDWVVEKVLGIIGMKVKGINA